MNDKQYIELLETAVATLGTGTECRFDIDFLRWSIAHRSNDPKPYLLYNKIVEASRSRENKE